MKHNTDYYLFGIVLLSILIIASIPQQKSEYYIQSDKSCEAEYIKICKTYREKTEYCKCKRGPD